MQCDVLQGEEDSFSVFVHSRPGFLFNKATTRSPYFLNRQVNDSIQVPVFPFQIASTRHVYVCI